MPPQAWHFPPPERHTLANGIELLAYDIPGQYVVSVRTVLPFPLSVEPREVEGVGTIMARLLDEGTAEHSSEEFAELLERKGIALGASVTDGGLGVDLDVPKRRLGEALDLLRQTLAEPVFPARRGRAAPQDRGWPRSSRSGPTRRNGPRSRSSPPTSTRGDRASRPTAGTTETHHGPHPPGPRRLPRRARRPGGMTAVVAGDLSGLDVAELAETTLGTWVQRHATAGPAPTAPRARRRRGARRARRPARVGAERADGGLGRARTGTSRPAGRHTPSWAS